jgi:hypothetical protein
MTVSYVTPFRVLKSFVEFYPKLGAAIAFSTMETAARMIPTAGGVRAASTDTAISDASQISKGSELVAPGNNSSPQRRNNSTPTKPRAAHKTPRKAPKRARATGRRKAA